MRSLIACRPPINSSSPSPIQTSAGKPERLPRGRVNGGAGKRRHTDRYRRWRTLSAFSEKACARRPLPAGPVNSFSLWLRLRLRDSHGEEMALPEERAKKKPKKTRRRAPGDNGQPLGASPTKLMRRLFARPRRQLRVSRVVSTYGKERSRFNLSFAQPSSSAPARVATQT